MRRSTPVVLVGGAATALGLACCSATRTPASDSSQAVTAPTAGPPAGPAGVPDASPPDAGTVATFQVCKSDSDCVAVPRVGCCHNGWQEAVAASQKDAYAASFTCPDPHPVCAMFVVRDTRRPACDPATHLCAMVRQ
jgi:hypothetical protein